MLFRHVQTYKDQKNKLRNLCIKLKISLLFCISLRHRAYWRYSSVHFNLDTRSRVSWQLQGPVDLLSMKDTVVDYSWNVMANGDAREGKWRGNWRMEWLASTLHTTSEHVYQALLPLMRTPRLPVVDWTDTSADLNGLIRFVERRNLVSARVPSRFNWLLHIAGRVGLAPVV
jgi:hypothetical protein